MLMHTGAQSFEISKLKDVIQKPSNLPEATTISDPLKLQVEVSELRLVSPVVK